MVKFSGGCTPSTMIRGISSKLKKRVTSWSITSIARSYSENPVAQYREEPWCWRQ